jgi:nicotinate phosphoribosyltransferase
MQQAVLELFPQVHATYEFTNRDKSMKFTPGIIRRLREEINSICDLSLSKDEYDYLKSLRFIKPSYLEYIKNFRFNEDDVAIGLNEENNLILNISGLWHKTILWEVPLMAIISQLYFEEIDNEWSYEGQVELAKNKASTLSKYSCMFADFGTRRRRSYDTQDIVIQNLKKGGAFIGTSNVHFAMKHNIKCIGTMAHEWIMGNSVLTSLRHANKFALHNWIKVYGSDLGIALTDTYGTNSFFEDFDLQLAKTFDGVRHDSGNPYQFVDEVIEHYEVMRIDPRSKAIVFSDGLDVNTAIDLNSYCGNRIKCSFGIGTHFTNDYKKSNGNKSKPLNIVIKLKTCDHIPVVKLSDAPSKATGDTDAIRVANWTFFNKPLDKKDLE